MNKQVLKEVIEKLDIANVNDLNITNSDMLWIYGMMDGLLPG